MDQHSKNTWIVLPAYNESAVLGDVIQEIKKEGFHQIIVVDDGSSDDTSAISESHGTICLRHRLNRGKGAAITTGIEAAKALGAQVIVTMDADGQHAASDIHPLVEPILKKQHDISLGVRIKDRHQMPWHRQLVNHTANTFTGLLFGLWVKDSQSGFRAFSRTAASLIATRSNRYEYESEVIREIRAHGLQYGQIPIHTRYTPHSMTKLHRQDLVNGMKTAYRMIWNIIS